VPTQDRSRDAAADRIGEDDLFRRLQGVADDRLFAGAAHVDLAVCGRASERIHSGDQSATGERRRRMAHRWHSKRRREREGENEAASARQLRASERQSP